MIGGRRRTVAIAGVSAVAGAALMPAAITIAQEVAQDVLVTNTTAKPVPTKEVGTLQARVVNPSSAPVHVQAAQTVHPWSVARTAQLVAGSAGGTGETFYRYLSDAYTVPAGKVLRVTAASAAVTNPDFPASGGFIRVEVKGGTPTRSAYLQLPASGPRAASTPLDLVFKAGDVVRAQFNFDQLPTQMTIRGTVTGELLPAVGSRAPTPQTSPTDF